MNQTFKKKMQEEMDSLGIKTEEDLELYIQNYVDYLVDEGFAVKIGDRYRLKTEEEIKKDLEKINNS